MSLSSATRVVGITFDPNKKVRKVLHLDGTVGVSGSDVLLLKNALLEKLKKDGCLASLGASEHSTTTDDIVIFRIESTFGWEEEVEEREIFVNKQHDLFFSFASRTCRLISIYFTFFGLRSFVY